MTGKDPKDMTASELLRWAADSTSSFICVEQLIAQSLHGVSSPCEGTCTDCERATFRALADKIDAELAQARELSLLRGAELWAMANGWPGFRDGEDFGQWLDRCALPRPCYENGEPVQFGDSFLRWDGKSGNNGEKVTEITVRGGDYYRWSINGDCCTSQPAKRPVPEVLGADGLPIVVGETVYEVKTGAESTVTSTTMLDSDGNTICCKDNCAGELHYKPEEITHTPPDTQERIDADARKDTSDYWKCWGIDCEKCPSIVDGSKPYERYGASSCRKAMTIDLLRRQRELGKRTGGDA